MADRYDELGEELLNLLRPGFGGRPAPEFVARVRALANEMLRIHSDGYVRQKVQSRWSGSTRHVRTASMPLGAFARLKKWPMLMRMS